MIERNGVELRHPVAQLSSKLSQLDLNNKEPFGNIDPVKGVLCPRNTPSPKHVQDVSSTLFLVNIKSKPVVQDALQSLFAKDPSAASDLLLAVQELRYRLQDNKQHIEDKALEDKKRKRYQLRLDSPSPSPPPRCLPVPKFFDAISPSVLPLKRRIQHILKPALQNTIHFNKIDRVFSSFWRSKIQVLPGQNRRHIPLVAVMKSMIQGNYKLAHSEKKQHKLESIFDQFSKAMTGHSEIEIGLSLEDKGKKTLGLLSNLRSHIFLGHGELNQIIGSLSDMLSSSEQKTLKKIDKTKSVEELERYLLDWSNKFQKKVKSNSADIDFIMENQDLRQFNRSSIVQHFMEQFAVVTATLTAENYPDLHDFKKHSRDMVKNLRDSYSTDISTAAHLEVRQWQNKHWLNCHQKMMELADKPDLKEFEGIFKHIIQLEKKFASLVSRILNQQGFNTKPQLFLMANKDVLNSTSADPVRLALTKLLQEP